MGIYDDEPVFELVEPDKTEAEQRADREDDEDQRGGSREEEPK